MLSALLAQEASCVRLIQTACGVSRWTLQQLVPLSGVHQFSTNDTTTSTSTTSDPPAKNAPSSSSSAAPSTSSPAVEKPSPATRPAGSNKGYSDTARLVGTGRKQTQVVFQEGIVTVNCTFSNTIMSLTDLQGRVKAWSSGGTAGFKNSNKSKPLATEKAAEQLAAKALKLGFLNVFVKVKGMGNNKQYAVTALSKSGLRISEIQEVTPIPYNGCRLPRKRRT